MTFSNFVWRNQCLLTLIAMIIIPCSGTSFVNFLIHWYISWYTFFFVKACNFWDPWKQKRGDTFSHWRNNFELWDLWLVCPSAWTNQGQGTGHCNLAVCAIVWDKDSCMPQLFQANPRHGLGVNLCQWAFLVGSLNVLESKGLFLVWACRGLLWVGSLTSQSHSILC